MPGLWFDEAFAVALARQPLSVMWQSLWGIENQMTLYYVLLHFWFDLLNKFGAGHSEFLIRLPSVVCAALAAVVLYRIGARWWGRTAGVVAAITFMTSPLLLRQAQEARGYALEVLLQAIAWYAFLAAINAAHERSNARRSWWAVFAIALALACYAHIDTMVCALAFPVALAALALTPARGANARIWGAWRSDARASIRPFLVSSVGAGLLIVPLALDALVHGGNNGWVPAPSLELLAVILRENFLAGVLWLAPVLLLCLLLALLPSVRLWRRGTDAANGGHRLLARFSPVTLAAAAWLFVPLALFTFLPLHLFYGRYLVIVVAPLALLVGIGVSRLLGQSRWPQMRAGMLPWLAPALRLGIVVAFAVVLVAQFPRAYYATSRDDYRTAATWLSARIQPGDGKVCWPQTYCALPMAYYVPELDNANYPGGSDWLKGMPATGDALTTYLATQQRVWVVLAPHGSEFTPADEHAERNAIAAAGFQTVPGESISTAAVRIYLYVRMPTDRSTGPATP